MMAKNNDEQSFSDGLNILSKLAAKYIMFDSASSATPCRASIGTSKPPITL
jgi:hypothetical protein